MKYKGGLYNRLLERKNFSDAALRKRIQRTANKMGISTEAALAVVAKSFGLSTLEYEKRLSAEIRSEIRNSLNSKVILPAPSSKEKLSPKLLPKIKGKVDKHPFLKKSVLKDIKKMSEDIYPRLYLFENSIREFITAVMEKEYGKKWWEEEIDGIRSLKEVKQKVERRLKSEEKYFYHGKRGAAPIYYTDFADLKVIIKSKEAVFNKYFKGLRGGSNWLLLKIDELTPARRVSSHHNPLGKKDADRVELFLSDWVEVSAKIYEEFF